MNAYFWQSLALLFGNNLKADYEPNGRDREIEQIVRSLERGPFSHHPAINPVLGAKITALFDMIGI